MDISYEGLMILRQRARDAGLSIHAVLADAEAFECRPASYDLIVNTFFLNRGVIPRFRRWLRPGGVLYFETHLATPDRTNDHRNALRPQEARRLLAGWDVLAYEEGPEHDGTRTIDTVRLVARWPGGVGAPGPRTESVGA